MSKNNRRITSQIGRAQVTGLVDKSYNSLLADSDGTGTVSFDNVRINGTLKVLGERTIINSTVIETGDKNIILAKSPADSDGYNNAGITIVDSDALFALGSSPSFQYNGQRDAWVANRKILINNNKNAATDSDGLVTVGGFSTSLNANTTFAGMSTKADSESAKVQIHSIKLSQIVASLDSDTASISSLNSIVALIKSRLDSDDNSVQALRNEVRARADSDSAKIQAIQTALNTNTAAIASISLDSDSIVRMFNEHSLINITADSETLKPLFRKVLNDFEIRDVSNNVIYSFFDET